jgi:hypothetical protein
MWIYQRSNTFLSRSSCSKEHFAAEPRHWQVSVLLAEHQRISVALITALTTITPRTKRVSRAITYLPLSCTFSTLACPLLLQHGAYTLLARLQAASLFNHAYTTTWTRSLRHG